MTPVTDEQMLRSALADLTNDQPPMPLARFQSVRGRAMRHRKRQLTGALVTALAVAGVIVGAGRVPGILHQPPQARQVPSWALPWPDYRNGSVPQSVLNNAVLAWGDPAKYQQGSVAPSSLREIARLVASYHVVWYVGQTVAHGQDVAVMFEANSPGTLAPDGTTAAGPVLVVGFATASEVMHGQPAWNGPAGAWAFTTTPAPVRPGSFGPDISEYVPAPSASGLGTDNWIVVLTAPGGELTSWTAAVAGRSRMELTSVASPGLYIHNAGPVESPVMLTFGRWREFVPVGIAAKPAVPALAPPPSLTLPRSFSWISMGSGQGNQLDQDNTVDRSGGPYAVLGRCYNAAAMIYNGKPVGRSGGGRLEMTISGHAIGTIACDGQQHELAVPHSLLRPHGIFIGYRSSSLTSWRVAFGRVHGR